MEHKTLLRFVDDYNLPITLLDEPYFSYFLNLYDRDFGTLAKYEMFKDTVKKLGSEAAFLEEYYKVRDAVIRKTKDMPEYGQYLEDDMKEYAIDTPQMPNLGKQDIYNRTNVGRYFVSVDMSRANFQVLKKYNKRLVFNADTYEEYMAWFTDMPYIVGSKYTRQVIFGNMKPKKQVAMQRFYMRQVFDYLYDDSNVYCHDAGGRCISGDQFRVFTNDEIVFETDGYMPAEEAEIMKRSIKRALDIDVTVKSFLLKGIGDKEYFVKEYENGTRDFKKIPPDIFPQVYKKYCGIQPEDNDFLFFYNGRLARYVEPLFSD